MKTQELANQCAEAINFRTLNGLDAKEAAVGITTPPRWKAPHRFPRGWIAQRKEDGTTIRYIPAMKLLAWLVGNGMAKIDMRVLPDAK